MYLSKLSVKRPIMMTMLIMAFVIIGLFSYFELPVDRMPEVDIPFVTIETIYIGAGPEEIENTITKLIEEEVSTVSGIKKVESYSMEGISIVVLEFYLSEDIDIVAIEVKDKVDAILYKLPSDAEKPSIQKIDFGAFPIVRAALTGPMSTRELYTLADEELKDELGRVPGIAKINITGGRERKILVEMDKNTLEAYGLTFNTVMQIISANNVDMPGGNFQKEGFEYSVRLEGEFESIEELRNLDIPTAYGNIKLFQIADIKDASDKPREKTRYYNVNDTDNNNAKFRRSVGLSFIKQGDANTIEATDRLLEKIEDINKRLPAGTSLEVVLDTSDWIRAAVADTRSNVLYGILFVALVLLVFLHDPRSTFIASVSIPASIISTFILMRFLDFSVNIITLMAFSVSIGTLVTNSVVVLENIVRHLKGGESPRGAADKGTGEIALAVASSALTNVVVFLPIAFMQSMVGQIFREFGLTVTFATLFSLFVSFTLAPLLASRMLKHHDEEKKNWFARWFDNGFQKFENGYKNFLNLFLTKWYAILLGFIVVVALFVGSLQLAGKLGGEFTPKTDESEASIEIQFPLSYNLEKTENTFAKLEDRLKQYPQIEAIYTEIGRVSDSNVGVNLGNIQLALVPIDQRDLDADEVAAMLRKDLIDIPDANIKITGMQSGGGPSEAPIVVDVSGPDMEVLQTVAQDVLEVIKDVDGAIDVDTNYKTGKPEIKIKPDREKLALAGLTAYQLATIVRGTIEGLVASEYREDGEEYEIKVKFKEAAVSDPSKIGEIPIMTPSGETMILSQLADLELGEAPTKITRKEKSRTISILANTSGRSVGEVMADIRKQVPQKVEFPLGYTVAYGGEIEMMEESQGDMMMAFVLSIILTYMLLSALLESFVQPLIILLTVPLSFIGIFPFLYVTGNTINILSMMAIVMIVGIVVNNGILIMDYTNLLHKGGMKVNEALLQACPIKLKPIIMSNLAIIMGMTPTALGLGEGAEFRAPLAIASIGGLISSTIFTLFLVPTVYSIYVRLWEWLCGTFGKDKTCDYER